MTEPPPTYDFITWYRYWCREGTAPSSFHLWAGFSLLSAAVQDRVVVDRDGYRVSTMALYVLLLGESGVGKGESIKRALDLAGEFNPIMNPFAGKLTQPFMLDLLSGKAFAGRHVDYKPRHPAKLWIVAEELANDVRTGPEAKAILTQLTALWGKTCSREGTRINKMLSMKNLCVNFLGGTTETWFRDVFEESTASSGTLARFLVVLAPEDFKPVRGHDIHYPDNYEEVDGYLRNYMTAYCYLGVEKPVRLRWDDDAIKEKAELIDHIEQSYPESYYRSHIQRVGEMLDKLAGLVAVSNWPLRYQTVEGGIIPYIDVPDDPRISVYALRRAASYYKDTLKSVPKIVGLVHDTPWTIENSKILSILKAAKGHAVQAEVLNRRAGKVGITAYGVGKAIKSLKATGDVHQGIDEQGKPVYWSDPAIDDR